MKIIEDYPPNWEQIKQVFPVESAEVVMAYDGNIYNPFRLPLRDDIIQHEMVHLGQQDRAKARGVTIDEWWQKYATNKESRIALEAEAYGWQVKYIRRTQGPRRALQALNSFAKFISGPVYGSAITQPEALKKLEKISRQ